MTQPKPVFEHPELDGKSFFLKGNSTGVLLIHGFTATTVEVRKLGEYLNKRGLTVSAPLLPGHETTPVDLNKKKYLDWIASVDQAFLSLKKQCQVVLVGGESMGAVLALYLAEKYSEIKGLMLYSPAIKITTLKYSGLIKYVLPVIRKKHSDEQLPWQGYSVYPLYAAHQFLLLQKLVISNLQNIFHPMIIFHGSHDETIDHDCSSIISSAVSSKIIKINIMVNSGHVMLLDNEFEKIADMTWDFIQNLQIS